MSNLRQPYIEPRTKLVRSYNKNVESNVDSLLSRHQSVLESLTLKQTELFIYIEIKIFERRHFMTKNNMRPILEESHIGP